MMELEKVTSTWARTRWRAGREKGGVDGGVDVLDAGVGHHRRARIRRREVLPCREQDLAGRRGFEAVADGPGQDLPGGVVDDGVEVGPGPVEEAHDGGIDMPDLVGPRGSNAEGGRPGGGGKAGAAPAALANAPGPGGGGGEDLAPLLGVEAQGTDGHVPVLGGECQ